MNIFELYKLFLKHPVVTTDSRRCPPGSIFFALRGEKFDGNAFAAAALANGCAYAVVDSLDNLVKVERLIKVDNVQQTLQDLARLHRLTLGKPVIGITGTNGKTTTKELVAAVLSQKYNVLYTEGNYNNHIGVPLTLLRLSEAHDVAVVEMGASHPGEISALVEIACPDYGLITNVGCAHLEGFGSVEGVMRTKCELLDYIADTGGKFFMNTELEENLNKVQNLVKVEENKIIRYGVAGSGENQLVTGEVIVGDPFLAYSWRQSSPVQSPNPSIPQSFNPSIPQSPNPSIPQSFNPSMEVSTQMVGDYNITNALAATAVGLTFGIEAEQINEAIANYRPDNNRSQYVQTAYNRLIIDAYNANPSSMRAALLNFAASGYPIKGVILGDMLELGERSQELHKEVVDFINEQNFSLVLLCGKEFAAVKGIHTCFDSTEALIDYLNNNSFKGYTILLKASHGMHFEKIIDSML